MKYNLFLIMLALNWTVFLVGMLPSTQMTFFLDSKGLVTDNKNEFFGQSIFNVSPFNQKEGQLLALAFAGSMTTNKPSSFEYKSENKKYRVVVKPDIFQQNVLSYRLDIQKIE